MFLLYEKEKNTTRTKDFGREIKKKETKSRFFIEVSPRALKRILKLAKVISFCSEGRDWFLGEE